MANAHDLRLTFRWPLLPNGDAGNGRQTFRTFCGGQLFQTNDPTPGVVRAAALLFSTLDLREGAMRILDAIFEVRFPLPAFAALQQP